MAGDDVTVRAGPLAKSKSLARSRARARDGDWRAARRRAAGSCNSCRNPRQYHPDINMRDDAIVTYFTDDLLIPQRVFYARVYICGTRI